LFGLGKKMHYAYPPIRGDERGMWDSPGLTRYTH
jgi:hypothetical protein